MIHKKTLLILGAGASKEFGMPLGWELRDAIKSRISADVLKEHNPAGPHTGPMLFRTIYQHLGMNDKGPRLEINDYIRSATRMHQTLSMAPSIDTYIDQQRHDPLVAVLGKLAITVCLLSAERHTRIQKIEARVDADLRDPLPEDNWLYKFLMYLSEGLHRDTCRQLFDNVLVVNFNYDRCFEIFSYIWLRRFFGIDHNAAAKIIDDIPMIHPYGRLGPLWTSTSDIEAVHFGEKVQTPEKIFNISQRIFTFMEQKTEGDLETFLNEHGSSIERIVTCGFAFHRQNLELLKMRGENKLSRLVGTAPGLDDDEIPEIKNRLRQAFFAIPSANFNLKNLNCDPLFSGNREFMFG